MRRAIQYDLQTSTDDQGFTLVELMVTMAISLFVMGVIYTAYTVYQRHYTTQIQVVDMQQNIRSAMNFMMEDIRMAGYNPPGFSNAGIVTATAMTLNFTKDTTNTLGTAGDGDGVLDGPNENITFGFPAGVDVLPGPPDGIADNGAASLAMIIGGVPQAIANNIHAIEFNYTLDTGVTTTAPASPADIRSVTISILARMANRDPNFSDTATYTTDSGATWGPFNDNFRRRLLIASVKCRNMGL